MKCYFGVYIFWCLEFIQDLRFHYSLPSHKYIHIWFWFKNFLKNYRLLSVYLGIIILDIFSIRDYFHFYSRWQPLFWWYSDHEEQKNVNSGKDSGVYHFFYVVKKESVSLKSSELPVAPMSNLLLRPSVICPFHTWALDFLLNTMSSTFRVSYKQVPTNLVFLHENYFQNFHSVGFWIFADVLKGNVTTGF